MVPGSVTQTETKRLPSAETETVTYDRLDTGELAFDTIPLPLEDATWLDGIGVQSVPAYNEADSSHVDATGTPFHGKGDGIGFVLTIDGTTVLYPGDSDALPVHETLAVDVLVAPIGGQYTMNGDEAADLARALEPDLVMPVHYDTFDSIEADADGFVAALEAADIRAEALSPRDIE